MGAGECQGARPATLWTPKLLVQSLDCHSAVESVLEMACPPIASDDFAIVAADRAELSASVQPVKKYVNKYLAHLDEKPGNVAATHADINAAIDFIGKLFQKYSLLLEVADRPILVPVVAGDLMAPFRVRWLDELPSGRARP